jgi:transposase InsO family protein
MALFDQSSCFVISKEKPFRIIAKGVRTPGSGLYRLTQLTQNLDSASQVHSLADSSENSTANPSHRESDLHLSQLWHSRLGHVNFQSLNILNPKNLVRGFPAFKVVPQTCVACQEGKQTREKFPRKSTSRTTAPLALVHTDICGPLPVPSLARSEYFILFTDDFSRKSWIYFLRTKDQALEKFQLFRNMIEKQTTHKILALCSDRGREFLSAAFSRYLHDHGIVRQLTTAHTPSQNGVSERKNRTILNMVRAMLIAGHVPKFLWTEAAHTAVQLLNSLPTKSNNGTTPEERFSGIKPDLSLYRIFGCFTFVHKHKSQRDKLTSRSFLGIQLGLDDASKAYRVYIPSLRKIQITRDVIFDETQFMTTQPADSTFSFQSLFSLTRSPSAAFSDDESDIESPDLEPLPHSTSFPSNSNPISPLPAPDLPSPDLPSPDLPSPDLPSPDLPSPDLPSHSPSNLLASSSTSSNDPYYFDTTIPDTLPKTNFAPYHPILTDLEDWPTYGSQNTLSPNLAEEDILAPSLPSHSQNSLSANRTSRRARQPPTWLQEYFVNFIEDTSEPTSFQAAVEDPSWRSAMAEEIAAIHKNNTWTLMNLPPGKSPISTKWVYKTKLRPNGSIHRKKARLVCRGYEQREGMSYQDTFAPVVKWASIRLLLALAASQQWNLYHMDVKTAFLAAELQSEEEVFVTQPQGFVTPGKEHLVLRLHKALYGLRQAPKAWYRKIDQFLRSIGFEQGNGDYNLYVAKDGHKILVLTLYVDDLLFTGNCISWINWFKLQLESQFEMSELGEGDLTLFLKAECIKVPNGIFLTQRAYVHQVLELFGMLNCQPVNTPMLEKLKLLTDMQEEPVDPTHYRCLVGKLIHLTHLRPDICFAVGVVSRFMANPQTSHLQAAKRILRYVAGTRNFGILYPRANDLQVMGYVDADFAGDEDKARSTTGLVFRLGNAPVTWLSKRQSCVALSSSEAEYMGLSAAAQEAAWLEKLARDLGLVSIRPIAIHCDNEASMRMAINPEINHRNKHINAHYHYSRERVGNGDIELFHVPSVEQVADILTKPLGKGLFEKFRTLLNICNLSAVSASENLCYTDNETPEQP